MNPTATLRNFCKTCPVYPSTTALRVIFTTPTKANQLNRYLFRSLTKIHDPLPQRTPHSALRYSIHIRKISLPYSWTPFASHGSQLLRHLSYTAFLTHSHTFARFDTPPPHPSSTRRNSNPIAHHPPHSSPFRSITYDTMALPTT